MADIYVDMTLASGLNDGTSWTDAYQGEVGLNTALTAANLSPGDSVYVKNRATSATGAPTYSAPSGVDNPVRVYGCQSGTTNEPPTASDLIPGYRTGASTPATDNTLPGFVSGQNATVDIYGHFYFYGLEITSGNDLEINYASAYGKVTFEECKIGWGRNAGGDKTLSIGYGTLQNQLIPYFHAKNCVLSPSKTGEDTQLRGNSARIILERCSVDRTVTTLFKMDGGKGGGVIKCDGCDFSSITTVFASTFNCAHELQLSNCLLGASTTIHPSTDRPFRV